MTNAPGTPPALRSLDSSLTATTAFGINYNAGIGGGALANSATAPAFVSSYFNALQSATVIDEGGNNINLRFTPLDPGAGNYHLNSTGNAGPVNTGTNNCTETGARLATPSCAGTNNLVPSIDFDGGARPRTAANPADRGADELVAVPPPALPTLGLLDNFSRTANDQNLGANWLQGLAGANAFIRIRGNATNRYAQAITLNGTAYWTAAFGATQGAAFTFNGGTNAERNNSALYLKVTGGTNTVPINRIRIRYQTANGGQVVVATTTNGSANGGGTYTNIGTLDNVDSNFAIGNTLSVTVDSTGLVRVWKTTGTGTVYVGSVQLPNTALWTTGGGRIGIALPNLNVQVDNFSGGSL